eukprot:SAG25_NODE_366_length_9120_cov_2.274138_9_plen_96_part_00
MSLADPLPAYLHLNVASHHLHMSVSYGTTHRFLYLSCIKAVVLLAASRLLARLCMALRMRSFPAAAHPPPLKFLPRTGGGSGTFQSKAGRPDATW